MAATTAATAEGTKVEVVATERLTRSSVHDYATRAVVQSAPNELILCPYFSMLAGYE